MRTLTLLLCLGAVLWVGCDGGNSAPPLDGSVLDADGDAMLPVDASDSSIDADAGTEAGIPTSGRIALGHRYTVALNQEGRLSRWGSASTTRVLPDTPGYRFVASGAENACALDSDWLVTCWRDENFAGPVETPEDRGPYTQVTVGGYRSREYACGLRTNGTVNCWMASGRDGFEGRLSPPSDVRFTKIDAGDASVCGITVDNTIACWGDGALGNELYRNPPAGRFVDVAVGNLRACGITEDSHAVCWGGFGEHLLQRLDPERIAVRIEMMPNSDSACVLQQNGGVVCVAPDAINEQVDENLRFAEISMNGDLDVCGITLDDEIVCWGSLSRPSRAAPEDFRILPR